MLRRATRADVDDMAAIHAASFCLPNSWGRDVFDLQLALPNVFGLLDATTGVILVRTAADEAEILTLAVLPGARRRGAGLALLRESASIAAALGARAVFLEVSVTNIAARALYTKIGFVQAGHRRHYYSDGSDAVVLRLDLIVAD
jgi:ribosomal-protein-alanine N-acetyltransferase